MQQPGTPSSGGLSGQHVSSQDKTFTAIRASGALTGPKACKVVLEMNVMAPVTASPVELLPVDLDTVMPAIDETLLDIDGFEPSEHALRLF